MSDEQEQDSSPLMPIEQQTIMFYGKPLVVVRLPDGRPGIVLRHLCDNLQLEPTSQVRRIKRTEAIADDLVYTQVQTDGAYLLKTWGTYVGTPSLRVKLAIPQKRSSTWEESRSPKWLLLRPQRRTSYSCQNQPT